ncbi:hypothetical protein MKX03_028541 [Papaver bracteatum]|nr:hypothetical protein MKX03_028541 [Papaver bracteatum]
MSLPFFKLGTLVLKTVCKPIATRLKVEAGKHPRFRQLIVDFAQWWCCTISRSKIVKSATIFLMKIFVTYLTWFSLSFNNLFLLVIVNPIQFQFFYEMSLPFFKLGTLVLKTVCKPIATRLKVEAGKHPRFRQLIVDFAQTNHRITTTVQRRIYGHATDVAIQPLNEENAVKDAADLLGEMFVFSVAGAALIFEVHRSAKSEARKEELRTHELEAIKQKEEHLERQLEFIKGKLAELEQLANAQGLSEASHARTTEDPKSSDSPATHSTNTKQGASPGH